MDITRQEPQGQLPPRRILMSKNSGIKFEQFQEYYGDIKQVQKLIDECRVCGAKLVFHHSSDYNTLMIQESCHCPECGTSKDKKIHIVN
jgi:rubredoxin